MAKHPDSDLLARLPYPIAALAAAKQYEQDAAARVSREFAFTEGALHFIALICMCDLVADESVPSAVLRERLKAFLAPTMGRLIHVIRQSIKDLKKAQPFLAELPEILTESGPWLTAADAINFERKNLVHPPSPLSRDRANTILGILEPHIRQFRAGLEFLTGYRLAFAKESLERGEYELRWAPLTGVDEMSAPLLFKRSEPFRLDGPLLFDRDRCRTLTLAPFFQRHADDRENIQLLWLKHVDFEQQPVMGHPLRAVPNQRWAAGKLSSLLARSGTFSQIRGVPFSVSDVEQVAPLPVARYKKIRRIGEGGAGIVWEVRDNWLGRTCALKELRPEHASSSRAIERFKREAGILASFNSPQIVKVHDVIDSNGIIGILMDLVEGDDLNKVVSGKPLPTDRAVNLCCDALEVLAVIHEAGVVHGDVKPANFISSPAGIRVVDFGISRLTNDSWSGHTAERPGSLQYMAPEQRSGEEATARSDIFGAGRMLFTLLAGHPPRHDGEAMPPGISADLVAIYRRATEPEQSQRYASAREMARALRTAGGTLAPGEPVWPAQWSRSRINRRNPVEYLAVHARTGSCAVMRFAATAESAAHILREAKSFGSLKHPGVVGVLDCESNGDWLATEWVDGCSVATLLKRASTEGLPIPSRVLRYLAYRMAESLSALHSAGLVHGALWPKAVRLGVNGEVKLTGFEWVEFEDAPLGQRPLSRLRYCAPEQVSDLPGTARKSSDLYSLGVMLWELSALRQMITATERGRVRREVEIGRASNPIRAGQFPRAIARCLEVEEAQRPASASELCTELLSEGVDILAERELAAIVSRFRVVSSPHPGASEGL
jgi:serine/threonine protein kinase